MVEGLRDLVRERAEKTNVTDAREVLALAAHLYAGASWLYKRHRSTGMELADAAPSGSIGVADTIARLQGAAPRDPEGLYASWVQGLAAIDALAALELHRPLSLRPALRERGRAPLALRVGAPVGGVVKVWSRPRSLWRGLSAHLRQERLEQRASPRSGPDEALQHLGMCWDTGSDTVVRPVEFKQQALQTVHRLALRRGSSFRVALCPLARSPGSMIRPVFRVDPSRHDRFTVDPERPYVMPQEDLSRRLAEVVKLAVAHDVRLLVLPELCVDKRARAELCGLLSDDSTGTVIGIVAGSFHDFEGEGAPCNAAPVLVRQGRALWTQEKRGSMSLSAEEVLRAPTAFDSVPVTMAQEIREDIRQTSDIFVLDADIGRLAVLLASHATCAEAAELARAARADFLLVASMSMRPDEFPAFAETLAEQGTSTLVVLSELGGSVRSALHPGESPLLALAHLALPQLHGGAPRRFRWRNAPSRHQVEAFSEERREWEPVAGTRLAFLLRHSLEPDPPQALVIDIGALLSEEWTLDVVA